MFALSFHIRCILLFFILIQFVSLYKIHVSDDNHPDSSSSSLNEELDTSVQNKNTVDEDMVFNAIDESKSKSKRSLSSIGMQRIPYRRSNRPHWNPLVAAYKRCGEFVSREEREVCFKDAVQMLFVHKL